MRLRLAELVKGRKLEVPIVELEVVILVQIQRMLDEGDHDSADRIVLRNAVLALRELQDLRNQSL